MNNSKEITKKIKEWYGDYKTKDLKIGWGAATLLLLIVFCLKSILEVLERRENE